jgi:hypothetical protein
MKSGDMEASNNHLFIYLSEIDDNVIIRGTKKGLKHLLKLVSAAIDNSSVSFGRSFVPQDGESFDVFINSVSASEVLRSKPNAYAISHEDRLINGDIAIKQVIDNRTGKVETVLVSGMYMGKPNIVTGFDFSIHNIALVDLSVEIKDRFASEYYGLSKMLKYLKSDNEDSRVRNLLFWYKGVMSELYDDYLLHCKNIDDNNSGAAKRSLYAAQDGLINIDNNGSWHGDFIFNMTPYALRRLRKALIRTMYDNSKSVGILNLYNAAYRPVQVTIRMVDDKIFFARGVNYLVNNMPEKKVKVDGDRTFRVIASYFAKNNSMDFYLTNNSFCIKL